MRAWFRHKSKKYSQGALEASKVVVEAFQKRRRQLIWLSLESFSLTLLSLAIVGVKLFYPFHVVIGGTVYVLSFVPLGYRVYLSRDTWRQYHAYKLTTGFLKRERWRLFFAVVLLVVVAIFLWLRPLDTNPYASLTDEAMVSLVRDDLYRAVTAMDYLESTGNELLTVLSKPEADSNQTEEITIAFSAFLEAVAYSESLTEVHRYFASIPYAYWNTRLDAFLIANSLYTKKYELVHRILIATAGSEYKEKALNQHSTQYGKGNIYNEMVFRFYEPKTRVRLSAAYYYQTLFIGETTRDDASFMLLRDKAYSSYEYLQTNFDETILAAPQVIENSVEQTLFTTWFPIQKGVATAMGRAIISTRGKDGLVTPEQALAMGEQMEPGDIMLQRRNWHISNVGIPGFWTHSALYTGDLATMDAYFASEFPYEGYESVSQYLKEKEPAVYAAMQVMDARGELPAVIEAIEPGVVVQTLVTSADADFVATLRPLLSKRDKLQALLKAFSHFGKPYDFNFDFHTRDTLVCSELVYDAYFERLPEKAGIQLETSIVNGRPIVSPFDIASKYVVELGTLDQELHFIYFLRGDEEKGSASVANERAFVESLGWGKFSFLQEVSD